jgi:hypothetical protein
VLICLAWDLWAVLTDNRFRGTDTLVDATITIYDDVKAQGLLPAILGELPEGSAKGPVGRIVALFALLLFKQVPLAMRLVTVIAHGLLVLQSYDLGRRLSGRPGAGLWAALLCGVFPLVFGLCRLSYYDGLVAVLVAASLQLMLRLHPDRLRPALLLGVVVAVGVTTKLSYMLYVVAPGLWLAFRSLRDRRWRSMLVSGGVALLLVVPYLLINLQDLFASVRGASRVSMYTPLLEKVTYYATLPGFTPLLLITIASAAALWITRRVDRWDLALFLTFLPSLLSLLLVNYWSRYLLPVIPLMLVITGAGIAWLLERLPRRPAIAVGVLIVTAAVGRFVHLNLTGYSTSEVRELYAGMVTPDQRAYDGFGRALSACRDQNSELLLAHDSIVGEVTARDLPRLWHYRGAEAWWMAVDEAKRRLARGTPVCVLLVRRYPERPLIPGERDLRGLSLVDRLAGEPPAAGRWLSQQMHRRLVASYEDPDGLLFQVYRVNSAHGPIKAMPHSHDLSRIAAGRSSAVVIEPE